MRTRSPACGMGDLTLQKTGAERFPRTAGRESPPGMGEPAEIQETVLPTAFAPRASSRGFFDDLSRALGTAEQRHPAYRAMIN
jgi:hypothetical protein